MKSDNRAKVASASRMVLVAGLSVFFVSVGAAVAQAQESCSGRVELWFLNDESTSVTDTEFSDAKSFISSVASSFAYDESTGFRGSLIGWEDSPTLLSGLTDQFTTVASTYSRGGRNGYTYPGAAFDYVADALTNYDGSAYASISGEPAREGVPSIVVFLTDADGVDSAIGRVRDASQLRASASAIRNAGHEVVVMLIAEAASRYTLGDGDYEANFHSLMNEVAGSAGNVVVGDTYANIAQPTQGYISDLSSRICSVAEQLSPTLPPASPELTVTKSVSSTDLTFAGGAGDTVWNPGDKITYAVAIENTGNVALDTVELTDPLASGSPVTLTAADVTVTGEATSDDVLEPGETWTYSYDYAVTQADIDAGQVLNTAAVTAQDPTDTDVTGTSDGDGNPAQDSGEDEDSDPTNDPLVQTLAPSPELTVVKTETSGNTAEGDALSWSIVVTNAGNVTLSSVTLSDDTLTRLDAESTELTLGSGPTAGSWPGTTGELAPGESVTYTAVYTLTQADIDAGGVSNTAVATGSSPSGTDDVSDTSGTAGDNDTPTVVDLEGTASINGVKTVVLSSDTDASGGMSAGDVLTYTITATNSGNVTLTNVGIESDTLSRGVTNLTTVTGFSASDFTLVPEHSGTLAPGEFASFTATYVLTEADIDAGGLSNSATVFGTPPTGEAVTDVTDDGATGTGDAGDDPTVSLLQPLARNDASYGNQLGQPGKVAVLENDSYASAMTPTVMLVTDGGAFVTEMTVAGEGVWKVGVNNKIRFTPAAGYFGDPTAVEYVITSSNVPVSNPAEVLIDYLGVATSDDLVAENDEIVDQDPSGPVTVNPLLNDADGNAGQLVASSVRLLDDNNNPVSSLTVPGEGSWSVDTQTGEVTFTPEPGFTGSSASVRYYVENLAGIPQTAEISILFIDPRGVVYDTDTLSPISGVSLQFADATGTVLPASCFPTGQQPQTTGSDGRYRFDLAVSCTTLAGREFQIQITGARGYMSEPAPEGREQGVLNPGTPATDVYEVVPYDSAPTAAQTRKYFTRFLIGANSRQIVNNHIPLGRLFKEIEEDLRQVLEDDLAATMTQQGQIMSGYAKNALARLRMNSHTVCAAEVDRIFERQPVSFATGSAKLPKEADQTLDRVARVMERCEEIAFSVHGYVDPASGPRDGYDLSQARANSVIAGLRQRGIIRERLQALPFRLLRSEAGTEGETENRIRVVSSGRLITDATCADTVTTDDGMNVDINGSSGSIDGNYLQERRNCARDGWTILSGSFSHLRNSNGMNQSMFQLSKRSERFISDDHLSGWFLGAYATSNDVSGLADGTIRGFGLNAGLYGARRFDSNLFLDYYFGAAAGRHRFDLAFGRMGGVISATGHYDYTALFMGVALSGQTHLGNYPLTPRVGLDVAWSPGGSVEVAVSQGAISDATGLHLSSVSGLKLFSELQFDDLLPGRPATLMAAPRLLCERAIGHQHTECGYGLDLRLAHEVAASASRYELALTGEHTRARDSYGVSLSFTQALAAGALEGAARVTQDGRPGVGMAYNLDF